MDVPYEGTFNGYGVNGAQAATPGTEAATYAEQVKARAASLPKMGATAAAAPAPVVGTPPAGVLARPISVPSWLKTAGGFGMKVLNRAGVAGVAASVVPPLASGLETAFNWAANKYTNGEGSSMAPNPAVQAAAPAPAPVAPAVSSVATAPGEVDQATMGQQNLATAMNPRFGNPATPDNTDVPARGTGFIKNNQTGKTTFVGARAPAVASQPVIGYGGNADLNPAAAFFGASATQRQIAQDNAQHNVGAKLLLDTIVKGSEVRKNNATADKEGFGVDAALAHLRTNPGDYANAGAIAHGRAATPKSVFLPTMDASKVDVGNTRTGKVERVTVPAKVNEADIQKTMATNKLSREQVMQRLKDEGRM